MILTCPECSTRYLTKENAIGPNGRTVRCAKCDSTWFVASEADELSLKDNQSVVEDIVPVATASVPAAAEPAQSAPLDRPGAHVVMRDKVDQDRRRRRLTSVGLIWAVPLALLFVAAILGYVFRQNIVNGIPQTATLYKAVGIDVTLSGLSIEDPITRSALVDGKPVRERERVTFVSEYPNPPVDAVKLRYRFADETSVAQGGVEAVETVMGVQ